MEKIILKRSERKTKTKRHSVIVKDDTYYNLIDLQMKTGMSIESLVDTLLTEAIKSVEVVDE